LAPEGLVCGGRDQRGAAVPAPPWHLRPMRNRPPSCCGARADGPWLRCPRHTHGGKEVGPNRADARIESTLRCRRLPGHRLMHGRGLPGPMHEGVDTIREQKTKNNDNHDKTPSPQNPDRRFSRWSSFSGGRLFLLSGMCSRAWASREGHDRRSWRRGPCSRG